MNKKGLSILMRIRMRPTGAAKLSLSPITVSTVKFIFRTQSLHRVWLELLIMQILLNYSITERAKPSANEFSRKPIRFEQHHKVHSYIYCSNACYCCWIYLFIFFNREFELVRESMNSAISMNKTEVLDAVLNDFSAVNSVINCVVRVWWNFGGSILVMKLIM